MSNGGCNKRQPVRMPPNSAPHTPVLLSEVIAAISPVSNAVYLDGTFGAGGYSRAVLEAADCTVLAIDRDPAALAAAVPLVDSFDKRLRPIQGCFGDMEALARDAGFDGLDGVMLDLGAGDRARASGGGKSGLHGSTAPDNVRRRRLQGKCHRKQTARKGKGERVR